MSGGDAQKLLALGDALVLADVPRFTLDNGERRTARVARIVDGDTLHVVFMHDGRPWRFVVRLVGIDTPELHPARNDPDHEAIVREARAARDFLRTLLPAGCMCTVQCGAFDKFGRILGIVWRNDANVNELLVARGLAVDHAHGRVAWSDMWPRLQNQRRTATEKRLSVDEPTTRHATGRRRWWQWPWKNSSCAT